MGLCGSIPIILRENGVSYENLSIFSLVSLPFSLKLLWAPIVDTIYIPSFGRRKSWLIPVQTISGLIILYGSYYIDTWIGISSDNIHHEVKSTPNSFILTIFFLTLYFLMATQDIVVDGWALTLLSRENVAYGTISNSIGQTFGYIISNQGFLILSDPYWCKKNLGLTSPLLDLSSFMFFWGLLFLLLTLILVFVTTETSINSLIDYKNHTNTNNTNCNDINLSHSYSCDNSNQFISSSQQLLSSSSFNFTSILRSYQSIYHICQLQSIQILIVILLTAKLSFGPSDAVSIYKLQEYGMPRSDIAILSPILLIVSFSLPIYLGPSLSSHPLNIFWKGIFLKLISSTCIWILFEFLSYDEILEVSTSSVSSVLSKSSYPPFPLYFSLFTLALIFNEISSNLIFNSQTSFFSKIADPSIGGTYMTLLNTAANLGSKWPNFLSLYLLQYLTFSTCKNNHSNGKQNYFFSESSNSNNYNNIYNITTSISTTASNYNNVQMIGNKDMNYSSYYYYFSHFKYHQYQSYHCDPTICQELNGKCIILYDGYTIQQILGLFIGIIWLLYFIRILKKLETHSSIEWMLSPTTSLVEISHKIV